MVNHATFKASLFMAAGIIDHETGTRDIRRLTGLYRFMPITATLAMVAAAAMAGVPLLNGFLSKEMFFAEALDVEGPLPWLDRALPYVVTVAAMFSVTYSVRFIHGVFFGPDPVGLPRAPHEPPRWMRLPIDLLVLACVVVGIFPAQTIGPFLGVAVSVGARVTGAAVQPCAVARLHAAAADERRRARGWRCAVSVACAGTSREVRMTRRSFRRSMPDASSTRCWSRCRGDGHARSNVSWAPTGCNRSCAGSWFSRSRALWPVYHGALALGASASRDSMPFSRSSGESAQRARWPRRGRRNFIAWPRSS